jgi:hypothetical protein
MGKPVNESLITPEKPSDKVEKPGLHAMIQPKLLA